MPTNMAYPNPFPKNHCVVHAWTHLAGGNEWVARSTAAAARAVNRLTPNGGVYGTDTPEMLTWWAKEVGLEVVRSERYYREMTSSWSAVHHNHPVDYYTPVRRNVTLKTWARRHPVGKWLVLVPGHAVAVINGVIWGWYRPGTIVRSATLGEVGG